MRRKWKRRGVCGKGRDMAGQVMNICTITILQGHQDRKNIAYTHKNTVLVLVLSKV